MKKTINKIFFGSFLSLALVACVDDFEYTPAPAEDASKTYVSVDMNAPRHLEVDGSDILVPFVRNNASGALDVTVALTDTSGVFTLKSTTVSFADGATTATAAVQYSYDNINPAATYAITVGLADGPTSEYTPIALPMTCTKAWQNLGMAQFYDGWWTEALVEKQLLKAPDGSETYRLVDPFDKELVEAMGCEWASGMPYLEFAINDDGTVTYDGVLDLGFNLPPYKAFYAHPSALGYSSYAPYNAVIAEGVVQFYWIPVYGVDAASVAKGSYGWWSQIAGSYISFPGGPDLVEFLEL